MLTLFVSIRRGCSLLGADQVFIRAALLASTWRPMRCAAGASWRLKAWGGDARRARARRRRPVLRLAGVRLQVRSLLNHLLPARPWREGAAQLQRGTPLGSSARLTTCRHFPQSGTSLGESARMSNHMPRTACHTGHCCLTADRLNARRPTLIACAVMCSTPAVLQWEHASTSCTKGHRSVMCIPT